MPEEDSQLLNANTLISTTGVPIETNKPLVGKTDSYEEIQRVLADIREKALKQDDRLGKQESLTHAVLIIAVLTGLGVAIAFVGLMSSLYPPPKKAADSGLPSTASSTTQYELMHAIEREHYEQISPTLFSN